MIFINTTEFLDSNYFQLCRYPYFIYDRKLNFLYITIPNFKII